MKLRLFHGRKSPNQEMDDWGYDAKIIDNVSDIACTYGEIRVYFKDENSCVKAQLQTGWESVDSDGLEMRTHDFMIETIEGYFGDWELIQD